MVVVAFALSNRSTSGTAGTDPTAVVSVDAPTPSAAAIEPCAQLLSVLPVQLDGLNPRAVHPYPDEGAPAVAWGNPAIVLQCGVARPAELVANSNADILKVAPVNWLVTGSSSTSVFTVVDRAVYIRVTAPKSYAQPPLGTLSAAIAQVLPAVCHFAQDEPTASPAPPSGEASDVGPRCAERP